MGKVVELYSSVDSKKYISKLEDSAREGQEKLRTILVEKPMDFLWQVKVKKTGCDPLDKQRPLNFIEQVNQTFTYLASFLAAEILFREHDELKKLTLNLGTESGSDIHSDDCGGVVAEVFSTVNLSNNGKLNKEIKRVSETNKKHKYVFYMSPKKSSKPSPCEGVIIWHLDRE